MSRLAFAVHVIRLIVHQRRHPMPPPPARMTKDELLRAKRPDDPAAEAALEKAWRNVMEGREPHDNGPPAPRDMEESYRLAVRAFVTEHPELFMAFAAAVNHDVRVRHGEGGNYREELPPWASAPWLTRLSPILDALLSHGIHIGIEAEGREKYDRHPEGLHATVAGEIVHEILTTTLTGFAQDHVPFYAIRIFADAFMAPYFEYPGQPRPGTARAWPTQLPGSVVGPEPSASAALARARRHAMRIRRRQGLPPFARGLRT